MVPAFGKWPRVMQSGPVIEALLERPPRLQVETGQRRSRRALPIAQARNAENPPARTQAAIDKSRKVPHPALGGQGNDHISALDQLHQWVDIGSCEEKGMRGHLLDDRLPHIEVVDPLLPVPWEVITESHDAGPGDTRGNERSSYLCRPNPEFPARTCRGDYRNRCRQRQYQWPYQDQLFREVRGDSSPDGGQGEHRRGNRRDPEDNRA